MKAKMKKITSNITTYSLLFALGIHQVAYATGNGTVDSILEEVVQVLLVVAGLVCLGKLIQIGILYMTSSAVDKSNAKSAVMPWLVGTIVAFGASWIGPTIIRIIKIDKGPLDY